MGRRQHRDGTSTHQSGGGSTRAFRFLSCIFALGPVATTARALARTVRDFYRNDYLTRAAALAFFFFLAMFPFLMFIAAALAYIPISHLSDQILGLLAVVVPPDAMGVVRAVLRDITSHPAELLSIGIGGAVLAASSGFIAMIDVLNIAYDVPEGRPLWKKWSLAVGLILVTGGGMIAALVSIALGPRFGAWLADYLHQGWAFAAAWPYLRWLLAILLTVLSVEIVYFFGPNVRQRFLAQIPGAALAVVSWVVASWGLSWYLRSFALYNRTFGALGAVAALMLWLYLSALAIIFGAELNSELLKSRGKGLAPKGRHQLHISPTPDSPPQHLRF